MSLQFAALFALTVANGSTSFADDWKVKPAPGEVKHYVNQRLYSGIKTQEAWDKAFKAAFEKGDASAVSFLVGIQKRQGLAFDVNAADAEGKTFLHRAASRNHAALTTTLLGLGADINAKDLQGNQPLHSAVIANSPAGLDALLRDRKIDINAENSRGERALGMALVSGSRAMTQKIMRLKPSTDFQIRGTPFDEWIFKNDSVAGVEALYPGLSRQKQPKDKHGRTLLHRAAGFGAIKVTKYLLEKGADPRALDDNGRPPYVAALTLGRADLFELYLKKDPRIAGYRDHKTGSTPLHIAFDTGNFELADIVLKYKPPFDAIDSNGRTPRDALLYMKGLTDPKDTQSLALLAALEKKIGKARYTFEQMYEQSFATQDVAKFREVLFGIKLEELPELLGILIKKNKPKLVRELLSARSAYFVSNQLSVFHYPELYRLGNWPLFEAVYQGMEGQSFDYCVDTTCSTAHVLQLGDARFLEKAMKLKPPINFGRGVNWNGSLYDQVVIELDSATNTDLGDSSAARKLAHKENVARLTAMKQKLQESGYAGNIEQNEIIKTIGDFIRDGKGMDLFKKYKTQSLVGSFSPELLTMAVMYDDLKLAAAVLAALGTRPHITSLDQVYAMSSPKMRELLKKHGYTRASTSIRCSEIFSMHNKLEDRARLIEWTKQSGLAECADLKTLLTFTFDMDNSLEPMIEAIYTTDTVKAALKKPVDHDKRTLLHEAALKCDAAWVKRLIDLGADPKAVDADGQSSLHYAVKWHNCSEPTKTVEVLLAAGIEANTKDKFGLTALDHLYRVNHHLPSIKRETTLQLLEAGADPRSSIFLRGATEASDTEVIGWLVAHDVHPIIQTSCENEKPYAFHHRNSTAVTINSMLKRSRLRQLEKAKAESCDTVKLRAETEYMSAISSFGGTVEKLKKAMLRYWATAGQNAGEDERARAALQEAELTLDEKRSSYEAVTSLCCGFNASTDRCHAQLACADQQAARNASTVFCDKFAEDNYVADLGIKLVTEYWHQPNPISFEKHKIIATRQMAFDVVDEYSKARTRLLTAPLEFMFPPGKPGQPATKFTPANRRKVVEAAIDAQMPQLYTQMHLSSLADYVEWKYPQCASLYASKDKVEQERRSGVNNRDNRPKTPKPRAGGGSAVDVKN